MRALCTCRKARKKKEPYHNEKQDKYLSLASLASPSFCSILYSRTQIYADEVKLLDLSDLDA